MSNPATSEADGDRARAILDEVTISAPDGYNTNLLLAYNAALLQDIRFTLNEVLAFVHGRLSQ